MHPAVHGAVQLIETRLSSTLVVRWVADQVGVSPNHLTVLFRRQMDCTVLQYIRQRRADQARHFLIHTDKPVKEIAVEVGIPDLQHFNKSIREAYNMSPRALRKLYERSK
jgi:transcriptional regulator GlxA family with amidase domain